MTHAFPIAAKHPLPSCNADLRACERHDALRFRDMRDYGTTTHID